MYSVIVPSNAKLVHLFGSEKIEVTWRCRSGVCEKSRINTHADHIFENKPFSISCCAEKSRAVNFGVFGSVMASLKYSDGRLGSRLSAFLHFPPRNANAQAE